MAAATVQPTSKSSKKKATRAVERADSPAPSSSGPADKHDDSNESPYVKELQKNIRNVNKKITNASKTDSLLKEHSGKSLEDLVAARIINADQKAQILKKPALQALLAQYEEQLIQHQKLHEQYRAQAAEDKAEWEKSLVQIKADAVSEANEGFKQSLRENLLVLSQFLRLAAYRREEAKDPESDESQAIEGVLLAIYSGDESAVASMLKLVEGSSDAILSVPGEVLETTYSSVKSLAQEYKTPFDAEAVEAELATEPTTDPTVAHATAGEIEAGDAAPVHEQETEAITNGLANASVSDEAANAVAESHWDTGNNNLSLSQEWVDVKVPRDPTETDTGIEATPAAASNTQSWADDQPDPVPQSAPVAAAPEQGDGFHQVQRNRGRHDREGSVNWRGRGRGDHRGRGGHRGDGRGRGRGNRGDRGGAGASRGPRRNEES